MIFRILLWAAAAAGAWLFHENYPGWAGFWFFTATAVLPPVMLAFSLPGMIGLRISLRAPGRVVRGSEAGYEISFRNRWILPVHACTVHLEIRNRYSGEVRKQNYIFRNVETSDSTLPLPVDQCGTLAVRLVRFECADALGLFLLRRRPEGRLRRFRHAPAPEGAETVCTVLPAAVGPETEPDFEALLKSSDVLRPKYGGGFAEDHELREYRAGDPVNSIHWKLSTKTDELIVREALAPENSNIFLVLLRAGEEDRGLELLRWLSGELLRREEPHIIAADALYPVGSEEERDRAIAGLLNGPMGEPRSFDGKLARCVFTVDGGELRVS